MKLYLLGVGEKLLTRVSSSCRLDSLSARWSRLNWTPGTSSTMWEARAPGSTRISSVSNFTRKPRIVGSGQLAVPQLQHPKCGLHLAVATLALEISMKEGEVEVTPVCQHGKYQLSSNYFRPLHFVA
jgi:hypothetical protein